MVIEQAITTVRESIFVFGAFGLCLLALFSLKRLLWRYLGRLARPQSWDKDLLAALHGPARLLVILLALLIALQFDPRLLARAPALPAAMKAAFILIMVWSADRLLRIAFRQGATPRAIGEANRVLFLTVTRLLAFAIALLIVLDTYGVSITPILASLGIGSIAVALALQDTLGNFFSGLYLMIDKPVRVGDYVKMDDVAEGYVRKIGWRSTWIELLGNNTVVVPNSKLSAARITNYDLPDPELSVPVQFGLAYTTDLKKAEHIALEVARQAQQTVPGGVEGFEPTIYFYAIGGASVDVLVLLRARQVTDSFPLRHEFLKNLQARYLAEGIMVAALAVAPPPIRA